MFLPNGFLASKLQRKIGYDLEGRLIEYNISRQATGGIGDGNSLYMTEAERFSSVTPFLKDAMEKDRPRRNYIIQPGGAAIYFGKRAAPPDPYGNGATQYNRPPLPPSQQSFGHETAEVISPNTHPSRTGFSVGMGDRKPSW